MWSLLLIPLQLRTMLAVSPLDNLGAQKSPESPVAGEGPCQAVVVEPASRVAR